MLRRKTKRATSEPLLPVPAKLPPLEGLDERDDERRRRQRRVSLWALSIALAVVLLVVFVLTLAALGIYSGLKDRGVTNHQAALDHYAQGLNYLEAGAYELAVAELELAMRYDSSLPDLRAQLLEAKELAQAQVTPTSETRRDAAITLYRRAVSYYESGELDQAVTALTELRGLDADYQRKNVETMLVAAHYQLGLNAVREDRLDDAATHFQTVLDLNIDSTTVQNAQQQLNLLDLYKAALSHWDRDWSATIQTLKGLYALAPDYKDVQTRLHDAYVLYAQEYAAQGDWCAAADEYAAAVQVFPLEETADRRDDAMIQCQTAAQAPVSAPTSRAPQRATPTPGPTGVTTAAPIVTPKSTSRLISLGKGRIVYPEFDPVRQTLDLYVLDLAQDSSTLLLENASQPAFAPGGGQLAFHNFDPSHQGLGIVDLRTKQVTDLTSNTEDSTPSWSPDAAQIVFASNREGDRRWRIYGLSRWNASAGSKQWVFGQMPAWSPDGAEIAYHGCDLQGNNCGLWIMESGGANQARLTTDPSDTSPSWKPDGSQVAFASARTGNWELYAVDVASGKERRLTNHPAVDVAPAWSLDGKQLAFLSNREGAWALYVLDVRLGQVRKVIATGGTYPDSVCQRLAWIP